MEKKLVMQLTVFVVALTLAVALGTAFWRASYKGWGEEGDHHQNHQHSLEFFQPNQACS